jgi:putative transposase
VKNVTVSHSCGKWYVSIQTEREVTPPISKGGAVGIDMGVARFATLSDGTFLAPLNSFKRHEAALRKAQQALSRKVKFSKNWRKAKTRVQRIHARIANARRDYLHKASTAIGKNHAIVVMEDLAVRNMSRSAAGTKDAPGKNVKAKSGLNRSILDQGWYAFRQMLEYKLAWKGGRLVVVPPQHTSQTCPICAHVSPDNRKAQDRFRCVECGFEEHADRVGAMNILSRGMSLLRDEGRDTGDASPGMPQGRLLEVRRYAVPKGALGGVSPDGLWIEPHWRSEAGTHRGAISEQDEAGDGTVGISGL